MSGVWREQKCLPQADSELHNSDALDGQAVVQIIGFIHKPGRP